MGFAYKAKGPNAEDVASVSRASCRGADDADRAAKSHFTRLHNREELGAYYSELERHQRTLDITDWIIFFSETILDAQRATLERIDFFIQKVKFYDRFRGRLDERQASKGGLSAENYISITDTSRATATRDLQQLGEIGALTRPGERRHTRHSLSLQK